MQVGNWTEDHGLGLLDSSLLKPPGKNKYKIVVVPTVSWFMTSTVGSKRTFFLILKISSLLLSSLYGWKKVP